MKEGTEWIHEWNKKVRDVFLNKKGEKNFITKEELRNSLTLVAAIGVKHSELIKYYWELENIIVHNRDLFECSLIFGHENYLCEISDGLLMAILVHFNKVQVYDSYVSVNCNLFEQDI